MILRIHVCPGQHRLCIQKNRVVKFFFAGCKDVGTLSQNDSGCVEITVWHKESPGFHGWSMALLDATIVCR